MLFKWGGCMANKLISFGDSLTSLGKALILYLTIPILFIGVIVFMFLFYMGKRMGK